jgi:hypothetical protein
MYTCPSVHAAFARRGISDNCELLKRRKERSQQIGGSPQDTGLAEETVGFNLEALSHLATEVLQETTTVKSWTLR